MIVTYNNDLAQTLGMKQMLLKNNTLHNYTCVSLDLSSVLLTFCDKK